MHLQTHCNSHTTQDWFDLRGRRLQETDALGNTSYYLVNAAGAILSGKNPFPLGLPGPLHRGSPPFTP
jgi:hypothetical protein